MSELVVRRHSGRPINPFDPDLPDPDMRRDPRAASYHRDRLTPATRRAYRRWIGVYLDWCASVGRVEVPANMMTLEAFAVWLAQREVAKGKNRGRIGMAPASIFQALSAVRALHVAMVQNPPPRDLARGIVEGHAEQRKGDPRIQDGEGAPALKLPTLQELILACDPGTNAGVRDRALMSFSFVSMARRHEPPQVDFSHIKEVDGGLEVFIRKTKRGKPRTVKVPRWDHLPDLCAVRNILDYRRRIRLLGIEDGPFFRSVDRWDNVHGVGAWAGNPFADVRMDPTTMEHVIARAAVRAAAPEAENLTPHSFRKGGASAAYAAGARILDIARQGGWADNSPVVFRYIKDVDEWLNNPMTKIGLIVSEEISDGHQ